MTSVIEELEKNYGIPEKQIRILKVLEFQDLTARKISKEVNIPIGRLYEHLNKLIGCRLIEKSHKKPSLYSFSNKEEKVYNFLKSKFSEVVTKEMLILSAIEKSPREIKLLANKEDFILESRRIYDEEKTIYFIERKMTVPYYFYPENDEDYKKVREAIKKKRKVILENETSQRLYKDNYFENLKKGKRLIGVTNKTAINDFFYNVKKVLGKKKFKEQLKIIINLIRNKNIDCKLNIEAFPYYMVVSENFVLICFDMPEKLTGLLIRDKEVAKQFLEFFDSIFKNSEPVLPFLKKFL